PNELDLFVAMQAVLHDLRRAELAAPVDNGHLRGVAGEEERLFRRRIAAPDHHHRLAAEEVAVAGGAGGNAVAQQLALGLETQHLGRGAAGDDERARLEALRTHVEHKGAPGKVRASYVAL